MKVRTIMTYVIVVVAIILSFVFLYKFKKNMDNVNDSINTTTKEETTKEKIDLAEILVLREKEQTYPYSVKINKSAKVNNINLYELKFENEGNLYIESIIISFVYLNENNDVIGVEVKEYIDIPSKTVIEELTTLNNGRSFHDCRWFVLGVMTQE